MMLSRNSIIFHRLLKGSTRSQGFGVAEGDLINSLFIPCLLNTFQCLLEQPIRLRKLAPLFLNSGRRIERLRVSAEGISANLGGGISGLVATLFSNLATQLCIFSRPVKLVLLCR